MRFASWSRFAKAGVYEDDIQLMKQFDVPDWYIDSVLRLHITRRPTLLPMRLRLIARHTIRCIIRCLLRYLLSVEIDSVNADIIVQGEQHIRAEIAGIEAKGNDATAKDADTVTILKAVLEAISRGIEFLPVDLYKSDAVRVLPVDGNKLLLPLVSLDGVGMNAATAIAEARQEGEFISIEDLRQRAKVSRTVIEALSNHGCLEGMSETNQLSLFG